MRQFFWHQRSLLTVVCFWLMACSQSNGQAPSASAPASAQKGFAGVLSSYEATRAALAADHVADALSAAKQIETAAKSAKSDVAPAQHAALDKLAQAAGTLSKQSSGDDAAIRRGFGEVSRQLVAILRAEPKLREGLHLFECPMAAGFKQWVARNDQIENPYMGSRMLQCGSARKF